MARPLLNLPTHINWKLIAVSPDMMDTEFCNKHFPFAWRSSLAISAYEPRLEDLPEDLCGERITYLKITCSITGYQPSKEETDEGYVSFPNVSKEALDDLLAEYFACYGVLLNVAVFPLPNSKKVLQPNPIDFSRLDNTQPGAVLDNPLEDEGVLFEVVDQPDNRIVDIFPEGGDEAGELDLQQKMVVTFPGIPQVDKVEARVVHFGSEPVTMEAFNGSAFVGTDKSGLEQGEEHLLSVEGEGIDQVIITAPERASLLEFVYYVPQSIPVDLKDFPHIIALEPKTRDLYQAATDTGEVLTASKSGVNTDKTLTHIEGTESTTNFSGSLSFTPPQLAGGFGGGISASTSRKRIDTDEDRWTVQTDASRERRETQGTTTQLSQMYNLLTGYHQGTNRAVFLMLPRPHILQPTDRRTFVQGLRIIEGIQEFFLVVARPEDINGLCVEAFLETGHFKEDVEVIEPPEEFDESHEDFIVTAFASGGGIFGLGTECTKIEDNVDAIHTVAEGWVVDTRNDRKDGRRGDEGHPGIKDVADANISNDQANDSLQNYNYQPMPNTNNAVVVSGRICGEGEDAEFTRGYRVLTRSQAPKPPIRAPRVPVSELLITSRGLCVCFKSGEECPVVLPLPQFIGDFPLAESIVDEPSIKLPPALLTGEATRQSCMPAMKESLRQIQLAMSKSGRLPRRYPRGEVGFLESKFFTDGIKKALPNDHLETQLIDVSGLPEAVVISLGEQCTVAEALEMDLASFARKTGLTVGEAGKARRRLLGLSPKPRGG